MEVPTGSFSRTRENSSASLEDYPGAAESGSAGTLAVIYTDWKTTRAALRIVHKCAAEFAIRLLVAIPVWYAAPLSPPPVDVCVLAARLRGLASEMGLPVSVELLICRDTRDALLQALAPGSLILMGRRRWRIRELQLARQLRRAGHSVLVVGANQQGSE